MGWVEGFEPSAAGTTKYLTTFRRVARAFPSESCLGRWVSPNSPIRCEDRCKTVAGGNSLASRKGWRDPISKRSSRFKLSGCFVISWSMPMLLIFHWSDTARVGIFGVAGGLLNPILNPSFVIWGIHCLRLLKRTALLPPVRCRYCVQ